MFVPNLEPVGLSSQIKDTKYTIFFSKSQNTHSLTHLRCQKHSGLIHFMALLPVKDKLDDEFVHTLILGYWEG